MLAVKTEEYVSPSSPDVLSDNDIVIRENDISIGDNYIPLKNIMNAAINTDTKSGDGVGGSAVFKTRELSSNGDIETKTYRVTVDENSIGKIKDVVHRLKERGISTKEMTILDVAFRRVFF